ncbi:MAG: uncharacterized protein QOJ22_1108 [Thermoleophilaceae bacterium]|nr:uncharacterized protein [Thermoleophilaceae bacterium]
MLRTRHLVLALLLAAFVAGPAEAQTTVRGISVDGTAFRQVPNDTGRFSATVSTRRQTPRRALSSTARATRRVLAAQRALGVARADLRTGSVTVRKVVRRDPRTGRVHFVGYDAANRVRVTVRDLFKLGDAIDAAVGAGATAISSLTLFPADTQAVYREVLGEAFDDAKAKAELLAARAGVTLGPALFIDEGSDEFFGETFGGAEGEEVPASDRTPVRPGTSRVEAFVSVLFETS